MSVPKERQYVRKNRLMLSCDEATYLASMAELENIPLSSRMTLRMHLMACKHCRNYAKQMRLISKNLSQKAINVDKGVYIQRLSATEKSHLSQLINSKMK